MNPPLEANPNVGKAAQPALRPAHVGVVRFSAAQFLIALVLFLLVAPLVEKLPGGRFTDGTLLTLMLASGVLAVGRRRKNLVIAAILVVPAIVGRWVNHFRPDFLPAQVFLAAGLAFGIFVFLNLLLFVLRAPRVNSEVLCAGVASYLLLGLLWAFAYLLTALSIPDSFSINVGTAHSLGRSDALYYSFVTLSTVGYGDITPLSSVARSLAAAEAMTGTIYVAVFIARLVALYSTAPREPETVPPPQPPP
jgi:hypothetical protein